MSQVSAYGAVRPDAPMQAVTIERREGEVFNVHRDAVAQNKQQNDAAKRGERGAYRIATQFERLTLSVGEHAPEIEKPIRRCSSVDFILCVSCRGRR